MGKFKEVCGEKGKSSELAPRTIREACEKVVKEEASRRAGRSYFVVHLPALQQFFSLGQYVVGIDGEEALQLVVCNLWRKI